MSPPGRLPGKVATWSPPGRIAPSAGRVVGRSWRNSAAAPPTSAPPAIAPPDTRPGLCVPPPTSRKSLSCPAVGPRPPPAESKPRGGPPQPMSMPPRAGPPRSATDGPPRVPPGPRAMLPAPPPEGRVDGRLEGRLEGRLIAGVLPLALPYALPPPPRDMPPPPPPPRDMPPPPPPPPRDMPPPPPPRDMPPAPPPPPPPRDMPPPPPPPRDIPPPPPPPPPPRPPRARLSPQISIPMAAAAITAIAHRHVRRVVVLRKVIASLVWVEYMESLQRVGAGSLLGRLADEGHFRRVR